MTNFAETLASYIRSKVMDATSGREGARLETRFIFHGPPLSLLGAVFESLVTKGGIEVCSANGVSLTLPVLLQAPSSSGRVRNPVIGQSGLCDEGHLLHLRNDPHSPSFVALVPPGQHNNKSVASTTDEFGVGVQSNTSHAQFDEWWGDEFIQWLLTKALEGIGLAGEDIGEARDLAKQAAEAVDDVEGGDGTRSAAWLLLSRLFSIPSGGLNMTPWQAVALACGMPSSPSRPSAKALQDVLAQVAATLADGFGTAIAQLKQGAADDISQALDQFLTHLRDRCDVPTAFERATPAFYLPDAGAQVQPPPSWWGILTAEKWLELMAEEPLEVGDLHIECTNSIFPIGRGMPAIVRGDAAVSVSARGTGGDGLMVVALERSSGSARTKRVVELEADKDGKFLYLDDQVPTHKASITYKAVAQDFKAASIKVISLEHWSPGILVCCRLASKLSPPKKPARKAATGPELETTLLLPGAGRYELVVFVSQGISIERVTGIADDATEVEEGHTELKAVAVKDGEYQVEIDADAKYQVDISYRRAGGVVETCRLYVTCADATEEGCRSEFERLIKLNRKHLERFDAKSVVQLDRHARISSLQAWLLDDQNVALSFRPLVLADDYAEAWAPPDWTKDGGTIMSKGQFLHDPRPDPALFDPPQKFVDARREIARLVRETDEQSGLLESAQLGAWLARKPEFRELIENYLDSYSAWLSSEPDVACWVDVVAVASMEADGRTLSRIPDAILLSPLHPLRLAWHCVAQRVLFDAAEGESPLPCPAASVLDPDCVPDVLTLSLQAPGGLDQQDFISVECSSDYWSVLWNGKRLRQLAERCRKPPFDDAFGITVGGISSGFSSAQVARALEDVSDLLAAKPVVNLVVASAGGATDSCNEGLVDWCARRFGNGSSATGRTGVGPRMLEVFDTRQSSSRPDEATIANLAEDTRGLVRWFNKQPDDAKPDLGIIAQLDSAEPDSTGVGMRSPLGLGGLIRHRVRRQLPGAFLSESRQGRQMPPSGDVLADKVLACMLAIECRHDGRTGLRFAPNVHAVKDMLEGKKADFVAVSSSAIDPACFLAGWINGAYLWDYDLPAYSSRAGDTSGYYLLSKVKEADRDGLKRVLSGLPDCDRLSDEAVEKILLEVARRGIPTVRGLSGDNTGATGDLGLFVAVRLLQDRFRSEGNLSSLLPVIEGTPDDASIAIIVPIDPFRGYLADMARSFGKDASLSRPDLLVIGIRVADGNVRVRLTPVEVKCRQGGVLSAAEATDALAQSRSLAGLFQAIAMRGQKSAVWLLAYQHLLLSMIGFGLRVYSQHSVVGERAALWAEYHEAIAAAILCSDPAIGVDDTGRLIVIDNSGASDCRDWDGDGFPESVVISAKDAGRIVAGDAQPFYEAVRAKVGDWRLLPHVDDGRRGTDDPGHPAADYSDGSGAVEEDSNVGSEHVSDPSPDPSGTSTSTPVVEATSGSDVGCTGIQLSVGRTVDGFEPRALVLNVSDTRLNQLNLGVVGDLGTGKTQLLKSLIYQISGSAEGNRGVKPRVLIFDYKRDYSSEDFVAATGARVVEPTRLPLNLFDTSAMGKSAAPWLDRFRFFADVLDKVYSGIGPVQRDKLKGAVRSAYEACGAQGRAPTIYDVHAEYKTLLGGKSDSPMAIIDDLVDMEVFARDPKDALPFDEFLDGVVVVSLDALGQDDRSKNMLVAVMLNMFYENMLKTPKRPFLGTDPQLRVIDSYLLVDEADNIMRYEFDVLRKLLLQGREFGVGVILASQYLRHFKVGATDYREPLLTWCIHKVPNATPAELGALGFTSDLGELSERVKSLPNHHCLYKSFDIPGEVVRGLPFYELMQKFS